MESVLLPVFFTVVSISIGVFAAWHALQSKRDPKSALAWVGVCLLIPIAGALTYLIFGINRVNVRAMERFHFDAVADVSEPIPHALASHFAPLSHVGANVSAWGLKSIDEIRQLQNGDQLYPALLEDIEHASSHVYISTYIFRYDDVGKNITEKLVAARDRGVDVRVIVDGLGELVYPPRVGRHLQSHGIRFHRFNPIHLIPPSLHINMRNHRKIAVIDGSIAYIGGQNLSQRHVVEGNSGRRMAQDLHFRLTGRIVDDLQQAFVMDWNQVCRKDELLQLSARNEEFAGSSTWGRMVLDGPNEYLDKLNELLLGTFSSARFRIWIMTPYFLPDFDLLGALVGARLRGVDVRIYIPARTNIYFAHWATQHNLRFILDRGLQVFLQPAPFVHTKAIVIDDYYTLIGSANLDARSLRLNFEIGLEVFSHSFNAGMTQYFENMSARCTRADRSKLEQRSALVRLRDAVAWLFSPYL